MGIPVFCLSSCSPSPSYSSYSPTVIIQKQISTTIFGANYVLRYVTEVAWPAHAILKEEERRKFARKIENCTVYGSYCALKQYNMSGSFWHRSALFPHGENSPILFQSRADDAPSDRPNWPQFSLQTEPANLRTLCTWPIIALRTRT